MAAAPGKHKLLSTGPTEPWSVREKLCLASSVMRSGDQNWVSVSRAIKPFAESGRPPDWFSQKHCASQYSELLETTETPKRKRGEKGEVVETVEDVIVRNLTAERIDELKKLIKETQEKYRRVKKEAELIQAGQLDSKLQETWNDIAAKKKREEEEAEVKKRATESAYQARQAAKNTPKRVSLTIRSSLESSSPGMDYSVADTAQLVSMNIASAPIIPLISAPEIPGPPVTCTGLETPATPVLEDSPQKKLLGQKATPPPSPLLSELLKKGNLLPTSPRLVSESDLQLTTSHVVGSGFPVEMGTGVSTLHVPELQLSGTSISVSPAATVEEPTICVQLESCVEQPSLSTPGDLSTYSVLIDCGESKCLPGSNLQVTGPRESILDHHQTKELEVHVDSGVPSLENSDILAIIQDKVKEPKELVLPPNIRDQVAISDMSATSFLRAESSEITIKQEAEEIKPQMTDLRPKEEAQMLAESIAEKKITIKQEPPERVEEEGEDEISNVEQVERVVSVVKTEESTQRGPKSQALSVDHHLSRNIAQSKSTLEESEHLFPRSAIQSKSASEELGQPSHRSIARSQSTSDEVVQTEIMEASKEELGVVAKGQAKLQEVHIPKEEDGASEAASMDETREEEPSEVYMSETDNEPPVSESDDGCSILNAHLQSSVLADSIPSSPASSQFSVCSEDQEAIQAQKIWKKAIMLVWRAAANHRYANVFLQPVTDDIAPGYHSIVHRPMDLSTIKKNIETGLIRTTAEFQRDIMLMFQNAVMYNSSDHDVYHMALEMQRDVLEQIQQFLATQLIMQTSESGISAKSLRGRESTRKQDAAEKDSVPMGSPAFLLSLFDVEAEQMSPETVSKEEQESKGSDQYVQQHQSLQIEFEDREEDPELGRSSNDHKVNDDDVRMDLAEKLETKKEEEESWEESLSGQEQAGQVAAAANTELCTEQYVSGGCELYASPQALLWEAQLDTVVKEQKAELAGVNYKMPGEEGAVSEEELDMELSVAESDTSANTQSLVLDESATSSHTSSEFYSSSLYIRASSTDQQPVSAQKNWKRTMLLLWKEIAGHRFSSPFLNPVTEDRVPGYHSRVHRPMDLSNIKRNIKKGLICTTAEFQRDIMLMFQNAVMYNSSDHNVYHMALEMQRDVLEQIQEILETVEFSNCSKNLNRSQFGKYSCCVRR
ncbi:bromodomain-containing protein 8 isoform X2 [Callorhinchus milii]|uniref:bromodomain-containing protein 8 isoform X2 n=1 Tax=Callorhinchus milii TaxID=7868 RepID=UPI00045757CD|nr:bromodomain-containing protein 8 isoform X2 [Callorhinchus milii]|eukprot:gi/632970462/ref/XP_007901666.1/ PREDICTED: bromodomain-containing protein 8 isoform X1 [Callorhinchus milii]